MKVVKNTTYGFINRFLPCLLLIAILSMVCGGCARKPRPAKPLDRPPLETPMNFDVAVRMIAFDLFAQISNQQKPANVNTKPTPSLFR